MSMLCSVRKAYNNWLYHIQMYYSAYIKHSSCNNHALAVCYNQTVNMFAFN